MEELITFVLQHWIASSLFCMLLGALIVSELNSNSGSTRSVSPAQAVQHFNHDGALFLDLRSEEAFCQAHAQGALNIPAAKISTSLLKLNKYKNKPIILICHEQKDANNVGRILADSDFENILSLAGGMQAWSEAGLPTVAQKVKKVK